MKRISIILLTLAVVLMAGSSIDAKKKVHKVTVSSSAIPSPRVFDDIGMYLKNPKKVKQMTGLTRLYYSIEKPCRDNHYVEGGFFIYGKNAKYSKGKVTPTGPHAFYYTFFHDFSLEGWTYNFSDESDRDNFWNEMVRKGEDMSWYGKGYDKGWYTINWQP